MHEHIIEDENGNTVDSVRFCSDRCHHDWHQQTDTPYEGWNGCHEGSDANEYCAQCGVIVWCGEDSCKCQRDNVLVNRFRTESGEYCEHGNYIQLPHERNRK
jgi:hypothetical protein